MSDPVKSYLVSAGDTNVGTSGFCVRIVARSPEEALRVARRLLPDSIEGDANIEHPYEGLIEYLSVYLNPANLTVEEDIIKGETFDYSGSDADALALLEALVEEGDE